MMLGYDIDFHDIFPLLTFEKGEEQICLDNLKSRGIYLYKQVYSALCNWEINDKQISYKRFSNLIRYDKSIRDKLYIYLAAAEEHLRNIIFDALEIDNIPNDTTIKCLDICALRTRIDVDKEADSNLYYYSYAKNFDLGLIIQIFDRFNLAQQYGLNHSDITSVRILRNKVMHHNMLLLSCFTERSDIERVIIEVELGIEALYRVLPTKELRDGSIKDGKIVGGLTHAINKSNYPNGDISNTPYDNVICLHKFVNGGFIH